MKKYLSMILGLALLLSAFGFNPVTSMAAENSNQGVIDLNNLNKLKENEGVTIKQITYEEMISKIAESKGISKKEARMAHPNKMAQNESNRIGAAPLAAASSTTLHEIKIRQYITGTYRPAIQLFVWTYNSGSFTQFKSMEEMDIDRKDISSNVSKQYQGKLRAEIQTATTIWWYINGDFYDNGTTTISGEVSAGGVIWSGTGSVSHSSSHYKYWNNSGTYYR